MPVSSWSTTAASNTTVDGVNIAENCPPSGLNDAIRAVMANVRSWYGQFYRGALVRHSVNVSIPNNTATTLPMDTEDRDTDAIHDTVTNTGRLTVPSGVTQVRLRANVHFATAAAAGSFRQMQLQKNGVQVQGGFVAQTPGTTAAAILNGQSALLDVVAGDFFTVVVQQDSGSAINVVAGVDTWFEMEIVR
jgi:hypothetical protein